MAASPNLLPWFETARCARLLTMRAERVELVPNRQDGKIHSLGRGDPVLETFVCVAPWAPVCGGANGDSLRRMRGPWASLRHIHHLLHQPLRQLVADGGASGL